MRYDCLSLIPLSLSVIAACTDQPTSPTLLASVVSPATRTAFQGFLCFGPGTDDFVTLTPGGVLRVRGSDVNRWVTGNPLIDGFEHIVVAAEINLKNGSGSILIRSLLTPDAVDGTWQIMQTVTLSESRAAGSRGVGQGTGDLAGMTLQFTAAPAAPIPSGCASGFGPQLHGVIIAPATP